VSRRSKDQDLIDELARWMQAPDAGTARTNGRATSSPTSSSSSPPATDEAIIEKCRNKKDAAEFSRLFEHADMSAQDNNASSADFALLRHLKFYTQDPDQLDRLMRLSALKRPKWDENRAGRTWLRYSIDNILREAEKTYAWPMEVGRPIGKNAADLADLPYIGESTKSASVEGPKLELVTFANRPPPPPREFVVEDLVPRHHATTLYGWGGTAKSLLAMLLALDVAAGREEFFGRKISVHGPTIYIDFELDADEQHRRAAQLARGLGMDVPEDFKYVCALGFKTHDAVEFALSACEEHKTVLVVLDSLGPAMVGDMVAAKDVIEFHNCYIAPFKAAGVSPILVDHQARQQAGEGYQSKGAYGSAYKEHLSRSLIQVEAGDRSQERGTLNVRLRHKKTNFGVLAEPFDVSLSFSDEMIAATTRDLTPSDRAQEATLNAEDRVVAALEDGPAYPDDLAEATGLVRSTVKNKINALKKSGRAEATGEVRGQMEQVQLVDLADLPIKGKSAKSTAPTQDESLLDPPTVADLFADPPAWLVRQLAVYREDPGRHFKPLCSAVAAMVLEDGARAPEVQEAVERELAH
jgi:hypothetical protein